MGFSKAGPNDGAEVSFQKKTRQIQSWLETMLKSNNNLLDTTAYVLLRLN